ncbi:potassium channel family protein [Sphingomonas sp. G-3-2-10]|uniref:potassium channel family protein n=1 Tax=Sphingomonas sp. G-3-2-10 TaxID=2728838 RepID=UPI00146A8679|nr:potassium channel family protein [Sphingomonas sp. G-3-2-10]NML08029.1 two pore domain potassium channel family protein [Sphingomonas sp. G-3-2-10]
MPLFAQLGLATVITTITVVSHLLGLALLMRLVRDHHRRMSSHSSLVRDGLGVAGAAGGLFALHAAEIWLYAAVYALSGALGSFEEALYFSTSTYTTIGYGDVVLPRGWRVFGAIEGANGIILLGWSTAFFVSVVGRIRLMEIEARER